MQPPGNGSAVATWSYTVGSAGNYGISARWAAFEAPWRATNATYKIYNNGILLGSVSKDQTAAGGQFNLLGTYSLSAGTLEVKLSNAANNNYVVADAVKIDGSSGSGSGSTNAAPNGTIDNPASSTVTIIKGGSVVFAGTGKDTDNNTPLSHRWSFGDGTIANSTQEDPGVVIYNNPGVYTATYTVTDALGLPDPTPATVTVTVVPRADPIAIVDNSDAGFSKTGVWNSSTSVPGYYGNNYLVAATGNGSAVATWSYTVDSAGIYEISARWTAFDAPWRATNATYKIFNNGALLTSVSKDQTFLATQGPQGNFELLGAYHLSAGTLQVKLSNAANNNYVAADAIQIVKLPANIQYYVGIGDSITWGWGDNVTSDDVSADGRDSGLHKYFGGYEPILNNMLTNYTGSPHTIKNEGLGGAKSADGLARMFPPYDILNRYTVAQRYLVFFGMNDASPFLPVPSGAGLSPGNPGYPGTFKDNMQQIIDAINAYGQEVVLAKCPIALGDLASGGTLYPDLDNGTKNLLIQEYNDVIDELRAIPGNNISVIPPDLYNYFKETYTTEYSDNFHPNGFGYQGLADQWFNALTQ